MNKDCRQRVEALMTEGLKTGAFPGAVIMWGAPGDPQMTFGGLRGLSRNRQPVDGDLAYDLASLTKLLSTTSLAMIENAAGRLDLQRPLADGPLARALKAPFWKRITPEHLLAHQSGLPAWRAFHRLPELAADERKRAVLAAIEAAGPDYPPAYKTVYSDLSFILLGFLLEEISGETLAALFEKQVCEPLGIKSWRSIGKAKGVTGRKLGYCPSSGPLAPTEDGFRWGGPIGDREGGFRGPVPLGRPHDDNAAYLKPSAGHAGLFGSARAVWEIAAQWPAALNRSGLLFQDEVLKNFLKARPTACDPGRPLGFNLLSRLESLKSSALSPNSAGHTGYTGPALWWDREADFIWLLLCNRVHPRATNKAWRASSYQAAWPRSASKASF